MRKSLQGFLQKSDSFPATQEMANNGNGHMGIGWLILGLTYQQGE